MFLGVGALAMNIVAIITAYEYISRYGFALQSTETSFWFVLAMAIVTGSSSTVGYLFHSWRLRKKTGIPSPPTLAPILNPQEHARMYRNRYEVNLEEVLRGVNSQFWNLSVMVEKISKDLAPTIVRMIKDARNEKRFRFLIIDETPNRNPPDGQKEPEFYRISQGLILHTQIDGNVEHSLKRFKEAVVDTLNPTERKKLEVRLYNLPITHTMIVIDPEGENARIHFEPFTYAAREGAAPVFIVELAKHPEVFKDLLESFQKAWDRASLVDWDRLSL